MMVIRREINVMAIVVLIGAMNGAVRSTTVHDINQDRAECTDQLIGMATCLPYVGGESTAPTMDCCSGLKEVLSKSIKCMCILVKDRDDPSLGLKINSTIALNLPSKCHSPVNLTQCIDLLKLPMSSPDAQMFITFEKSLESKNTTTNSTPPPATSSNSSETAAVKNRTTRITPPWLAAFLQIATVASSGILVTWDFLHI